MNPDNSQPSSPGTIEAPQAAAPDQNQTESIPGLVHPAAPEVATANAAAANPGAEIPTQTPNTTNASVNHTETAMQSSAVSPSEFRATPTSGKGPWANESVTTPAAAPGLEETPKPIIAPPVTEQAPATAQASEPTPSTPPAQDTPTQIDASGMIQTPTENASTNFTETPVQPTETNNQAEQTKVSSEAEVLKNMDPGNMPLVENGGQDKGEKSEIESLQNTSNQAAEPTQELNEGAETENQTPTPLIETFKKFDEMLKGAGDNKSLQEVILNAAHTVAKEAATNEAIPASPNNPESTQTQS